MFTDTAGRPVSYLRRSVIKEYKVSTVDNFGRIILEGTKYFKLF